MNDQESNRQILCDIARCAFEVVNRLLERDRVLARELRSRTTQSRQIYREESITAEMAATLRERFPQHVDITLFTASEETRTGADWYWRFEKRDRAIHARVQAKRVQRTEFGQADHAGHIDIDQSQLKELVLATNATVSELPGLQAWLATYARFDATPPCGKTDLQRCRRHHHETRCADYTPSLWIGQANEILNLDINEAQVWQIVEHSVRLDCILPCIDAPASDGPAMKGFALDTGLLSYRDCIARIQDNARLRAQFKGAMCIAI